MESIGQVKVVIIASETLRYVPAKGIFNNTVNKLQGPNLLPYITLPFFPIYYLATLI